MEFPYTNTPLEKVLSFLDEQLSMPENRRSRLRKLLMYKPCISVLEAHNGLTGLIVENTKIKREDGTTKQFDAMWVSSLCDSTAKGKPDIELVDMTSRISTLEEIMEARRSPSFWTETAAGRRSTLCLTFKRLERMGISAIIIEDKVGLKKNSLFGTGAGQTQDTVEGFSAKISAGKNALKTKDFMDHCQMRKPYAGKRHGGRAHALPRLCHGRCGRGYDTLLQKRTEVKYWSSAGNSVRRTSIRRL